LRKYIIFILFYNLIYATNVSCNIKEQNATVEGFSLDPIVKNGQKIKILFGFYRCNDIKRDDIVVYDYKYHKIPLIKVVKALPNDKFSIIKNGRFFNVYVNVKILKKLTK
jgi:hypothetical protein